MVLSVWYENFSQIDSADQKCYCNRWMVSMSLRNNFEHKLREFEFYEKAKRVLRRCGPTLVRPFMDTYPGSDVG